MSLTLEPLSEDPWGLIVDTLKTKIENSDLSFVKYLDSIGLNDLNVYHQRAPGKFGWDPPISKCPAIILLASAFPSVDDRGAGDERWYFSVTVLFKMPVRRDAQEAFQACHELIRTIFAGWRPGTLDPLSTIDGVGAYAIDGNIAPDIADPESGRGVARLAFDLRFRLNQQILG